MNYPGSRYRFREATAKVSQLQVYPFKSMVYSAAGSRLAALIRL